MTAPMPPHNKEAEESVLGAMLLSSAMLPVIFGEERLAPEDFYYERHRVIFAAAQQLYAANQPVDPLTLVDRLQQNGDLERAGGPAAIDALTASVPLVGNARRYAQIVKEHASDRALLEAAYRIQAIVHERHGDTAQDRVDQAARLIFALSQKQEEGGLVTAGDAIAERLEELEVLASSPDAVKGTPTGYLDFDRHTGGLRGGQMVIVAGRPGMGKSVVGVNWAEHISLEAGLPVLVFSLEMSRGELADRLMASQGRYSAARLRDASVGDTDWPRLVEVQSRFAQAAPMWIYDGSDINVMGMRAIARRVHAQSPMGLGAIVVDYLQLIRPDGGANRTEQVSEISRNLKILARELNVPVIAISQLSRAVEMRPDKRPTLADLRESGQLEADADLVVFVYRHEYYEPDDPEHQNLAELLLRKFRGGESPHDVMLTFRKEEVRMLARARER